MNCTENKTNDSLLPVLGLLQIHFETTLLPQGLKSPNQQNLGLRFSNGWLPGWGERGIYQRTRWREECPRIINEIEVVRVGRESQWRDLCLLIGKRFSYRSTCGTWGKSDKGKAGYSYMPLRGPPLYLKQCSYELQPGRGVSSFCF